MRALDTKLFRDIKRLWAQSLAVALVLAAGVATMLIGVGAQQSLSETRQAFYERSQFAHVFASVVRAPKSVVVQLRELEEKGTTLSPSEMGKLYRYQKIYWQQVIYEKRADYFKLWKSFNENQISINEFKFEFFLNYNLHSESKETLRPSPAEIKRFQITDKADGFASVIARLYVILFKWDENQGSFVKAEETTKALKEIFKVFESYE